MSVIHTEQLHRKSIGVLPSSALHRRRRLFGALEQAFPVSFTACELDKLGDADGILALSDAHSAGGLERLLRARGLPTLIACEAGAEVERSGGRPERSAIVQVGLSAAGELARPLRGRTLPEIGPAPCALAPQGTGHALAAVGGRPVWWRADRGRAPLWLSAYAPDELAADEALRDRLCSGRFLAMSALVHLLWHVCGLDVTERELRACFVVDDPNLHRCSYGYLRYRELAAHATAHGYHIAFAMVPLDARWASRRAAALFKANPDALSLLMHGNDHISRELGCRKERQMEATLAEALRRVAAFERRTGVPVSRVMAPPHEVCSQAALTAMSRLGFDATCISRPYPWKDRPHSWEFSPLIKWRAADMVAGGFPILPRHAIERPWDELLFAALLGQPLILFAHHWDFADGLDVLARAAEHVNGLGSVRWGSMSRLAADGFSARRANGALVVELSARAATIAIPPETESVQLLVPDLFRELRPSIAYGAGRIPLSPTAGGWASEPLRLPAGPLKLRLEPEAPLDPASMRRPGPRPWPPARRLLVEGRDRLRPLLAGAGELRR